MNQEKPKIESGIPIAARKWREAKYPWADMKVGDSFFAHSKQTSMSACKRYAQTKTKFKFTVRTEGTGTRVWRIA